MVKKDDSAKLTEKLRVRATGNTKAEWSSVAPDVLREAVSAVSRAGGALTLGLNSERTAFTVTVLYGGDKHTEFVEADRDITEYLRRVIEAWSS